MLYLVLKVDFLVKRLMWSRYSHTLIAVTTTCLVVEFTGNGLSHIIEKANSVRKTVQNIVSFFKLLPFTENSDVFDPYFMGV